MIEYWVLGYMCNYVYYSYLYQSMDDNNDYNGELPFLNLIQSLTVTSGLEKLFVLKQAILSLNFYVTYGTACIWGHPDQ